MDYKEFCRNIDKAGLKNEEFAELMKMNENSISNLKTKEEVPKHLAVIASLLGHMKDNNLDFMSIFDKLDIKHHEKRNEKFGVSKNAS